LLLLEFKPVLSFLINPQKVKPLHNQNQSLQTTLLLKLPSNQVHQNPPITLKKRKTTNPKKREKKKRVTNPNQSGEVDMAIKDDLTADIGRLKNKLKRLNEKLDTHKPTDYPLVPLTFVLVFTYLKSINDLPVLSNQTGLQNLTNTIQTNIKRIQALEIPTTGWDPFIVHIIYERLDPFSRREVETVHPDNVVPALQQVLSTLAPLALAHENTRGKQNSPSNEEFSSF
jgi:Protein of unknown function (DUF1759)